MVQIYDLHIGVLVWVWRWVNRVLTMAKTIVAFTWRNWKRFHGSYVLSFTLIFFLPPPAPFCIFFQLEFEKITVGIVYLECPVKTFLLRCSIYSHFTMSVWFPGYAAVMHCTWGYGLLWQWKCNPNALTHLLNNPPINLYQCFVTLSDLWYPLRKIRMLVTSAKANCPH